MDLQPCSGSGRWEMGTIVNWIQNILQKKRFPNFYFLQFAMQSEDLTKKKGAWKSGVFEKDIKTKLLTYQYKIRRYWAVNV